MPNREVYFLDDQGVKRDASLHNPILRKGANADTAKDNRQALIDLAANLFNLPAETLDQAL